MTVTGVLRRLSTVPRPTGWHLFLGLLLFALGSEYWDKDPLEIGGIVVPWPRYVLALLALPLLIHPRDWRWSALVRVPGPLLPVLVFWLGCALSIVGFALAPRGGDVAQYVRTLLHLTTYVVFVVVLVKWITWPRLFMLVKAYYVLGVVAAILSILQLLHGGFGLFEWPSSLRFQSGEYVVASGVTTGFRAASFFGEPSWAGRYYVHFTAVALAFWWRTGQRRHLAAIALFLLAFYAANSLLGYVVLATFVLAVVLAQLWRRNVFTLTRRKKLVMAAGAYAFLLLWLVGLSVDPPDLLERTIVRVPLVLQGGGGAGNRIDGVLAGVEVWKQAPVLGVGLGNVDNHIVQFYRDPAWVLRSQFAADSTYVQLAAEAGIPGLLAFLWFWGSLLSFSLPRGFRLGSPESVEAYTWLAFLRVDLLAQAVGMLNYADYLNPHLWTVVGIALACKVLIRRDACPPDREPAPALVAPGMTPSLA